MSAISYKELRLKLRREIWPARPGEAANLVDAHNAAFEEAMTELSRWVPCLQEKNADVFPACSTYLNCARTIVAAPVGDIHSVFTIGNGDWCSRIDYRQATIKELECFIKSVARDWTPPPNTDMESLPQGSKFFEKAVDSKYGRAVRGLWSVYRNRLYVAPWLQSNESLVILWDGWKRAWNEEDMLEDELWDRVPQKAAKSYVRWQHEDNFGCDRVKARDLREAWETDLAQAMYWCRRRSFIVEEEPICDEAVAPLIRDIQPPEEEDSVGEATVIFANVGDIRRSGNTDRPTAGQEVADLVESWEPAYVISNGDQIYTGTYESELEPLYGDFVGDALADNKFWPTLGNHDYQDGGIDSYFAYFKIPDNRTYYSVRRGFVEFFMLNNEIWEADGREPNSAQAQWLRVRLAASRAIWKVVVMQNPPYTSSPDRPGHAFARWPYKEWGADIVFAGDTHAYERYEVNGLTYVVNGAAGAIPAEPELLDPIDDPLLGIVTKARFDGYGAIRIEAQCLKFKVQFWDIDEVKRDEFELTKATPTPTKPTATVPVDVVPVRPPVLGTGYFHNGMSFIRNDQSQLWHLLGIQVVDGHPVAYLHQSAQPDYGNIVSGASQARFKSGWLQIKADTGGLWFNVGIVSVDGQPSLYFVEPGETEDAPEVTGNPVRGRFFDGEIQVRNDTNGLWYAIRSTTVDGQAILYLQST